MKLSKYKADFYEFSSKASEVARTAAFAGLALVWIFKVEGAPPRPPLGLLPATIAFATALFADLLHYAVGATTWGLFHRFHERRLKDVTADPELSHPKQLSWSINFLFIAKIVIVVVGYVFVGYYFLDNWSKWFGPPSN